MSETALDPSVQAIENPNLLLDRMKVENARLRTLLSTLMEAVEPFADIANEISPHLENDHKNTMAWAVPKVGDLRRAREAYLKAKSQTNKEG